MHEAMFWNTEDQGRVRCELCRFHCVIGDGQRGRCRVRENRDGVLYSLNDGLAIATHIDPIEKKPLFHVMPGSHSYSVAAMGCNFRCRHCQNATISQLQSAHAEIVGEPISSRQIVRMAVAGKCQSISYTYTEPTVFYEYMYETALLAREEGLLNLMVSNGYMAEAPLRQLAPQLDAANIDLKGFSESFYREICGAELGQVLESLKLFKELGIWLEVTTLLIPGYNDDARQLEGIARFIAEQLGVNTPWHVTAFYPTYRLTDVPPTPLSSLERASEIGRQSGLTSIYLGNVDSGRGEHSYCVACGALLIERNRFRVVENHLHQGRCPDCGAAMAGVALAGKTDGSGR
ncbi:MAG: AmmeMemoRadiSam system radical SAM enzyme [Desulfuromonas sp.]|nr:MAG: AmmeMemoRadiSam system radical SAM enzyme [Desulfuromonas sp.]